MNWPEACATLFGLIGVALIFHGFPNINIGNKYITHKHYHDGVEEETEEEE